MKKYRGEFCKNFNKLYNLYKIKDSKNIYRKI